MTSVSLPFLMGYSLAVTAALVWLNRRGAGILGAAGGTLMLCIALGLVQSVAFWSSPLAKQAIQSWALFVVLPSAFVFAVSRLGIVQARPWGFLFLGPLTFVVAVILVTVVYNVLFASSRSH